MDLSDMTDVELKQLYEQLQRLINTGVTSEQPLRNMIDEEARKENRGAILSVSTNILMETSKRWYENCSQK